VCPAEPGYDVTRLVDAGYAVLSVDVREYINDTRGDSEFHSWVGGVLLGKSIFAMKTWDVMRGIDYLVTRSDVVDTAKLGVLGTETIYDAMYALYAAALDTRIKVSVMSELLTTYKPEIPSADAWNDWNFALYLPRVLQYADVSQVASLVAPGCLMLADGRNTRNLSVSVSDMEAAFLSAQSSWQLLGVEDRLAISGNAGQDEFLAFFNGCIDADIDRTSITFKGTEVPLPAYMLSVARMHDGVAVRYRLTISDEKSPAYLRIGNCKGGVVRDFLLGESEGTVYWNGQDHSGKSLYPGVFIISLMRGGRVIAAKTMYHP
jgi:hypothetical protein